MHVPVARIVSGLAAAAVLVAATPAAQPTLLGFSDSTSKTEREWEDKFRAIPEPANMRAAMRRLTARPHHVGSPYDKDNAEWILAQFKEYGLDAHIETLRRAVPDAEGARASSWWRRRTSSRSCRSRRSPQDPTSNQKAEQLPTYNAYSIDGDVTAPLVYVNYGMPADYDELDAPRHFGEGRDRHRALRRLVARHQAQGRGGAWRGRLPHLLRSARRRLRRGRRVPERADAPARWRAARQRDGHAALSRRSADAGRRRDEGCEAPRRSPKRRRSRRFRCCRSRTATRSRCSRRSAVRSPRRHGAAACPSPTDSAPVPRRCISRSSRLGRRSRSTTSSRRFPAAPSPTSG